MACLTRRNISWSHWNRYWRNRPQASNWCDWATSRGGSRPNNSQYGPAWPMQIDCHIRTSHVRMNSPGCRDTKDYRGEDLFGTPPTHLK